MPSKGDDITGGDQIKPVEEIPAAFAAIGRKINELVSAANGAKVSAKSPLMFVPGSGGKLLVLDIDALQKLLYPNPKNTAGLGGGGGDTSDLEDRVAALEAKLADVGHLQTQSVSVCGVGDLLVVYED